MSNGKGMRWRLIALVALLILLVASAVGFRMAADVLKGKVAEALGPGSELQDLRVGWSGVIVEGLRIKGPQGWPAADTLRAERVRIVPSLRSGTDSVASSAPCGIVSKPTNQKGTVTKTARIPPAT